MRVTGHLRDPFANFEQVAGKKQRDTAAADAEMKRKKEEVKLRSPQEILAEMEILDEEAENVRTLISKIIGLPD